MEKFKRTSAIKKAKEFAQILRKEKPDYFYLKDIFKFLKKELEIKAEKSNNKKLPYVPSDDELKKFYKVVWEAKNFQDMLIIKTLLYTGCRVGCPKTPEVSPRNSGPSRQGNSLFSGTFELDVGPLSGNFSSFLENGPSLSTEKQVIAEDFGFRRPEFRGETSGVFGQPRCRVSEIVNIKIVNVDFDACQIKINEGKGKKDRIVPFPVQFKDVLKGHVQKKKSQNAVYLFESSWHKKYTPRGIQKMFKRYVTEADISASLTPHKMRHYLFRWLKTQGIDDALIQPYSGHVTRQSLEIYSKLSLNEAQEAYDEKMKNFLI